MGGIMKFIYLLVLLGFVLLCCTVEEEAIEDENRLYCEMVELNQSDPTLGWPDYKNNYSEICK